MITSALLDSYTIHPQGVMQSICFAIQDMMVQGVLPLGSRLPEVELCLQLGVSRPSLREAFRILQQQGLIKIEPRKGATVMSVSEDDLRSFCEFRAEIEDFALRLALPNLTKSDNETMQMAVSVMEMCATNGNSRSILEADKNFHNVIYRRSNNPYLVATLENMSPKIRIYSFMYKYKHAQFIQTWDRHKKLLEAYQSGDIQFALTANRHHILVDSLNGSLEFLKLTEG